MFQWLKNKISATWQKFKDWSGWTEAGSIFTMRLEAAVGFSIAVLGGIDWSPLLTLDFSNTISNGYLLGLGGVMFVKAIVQEVVRRKNATDL